MSVVDFAVLGPLEVRRDGQVLDLGGPRQRAVLAFLLTHRREPVSLDRMIDELWGEDAPPKATASLQAYVSNLRRVLEPDRPPRAPAQLLVSRPPGYALDVGDDRLDALRFERAADAARDALTSGDPAGALEHAARGLDEWRGEVLADFPYDDFADAERGRLTDRRVVLEQDRAAALLALDRPDEAAALAETLTTDHPLREQAWELLMLARYRSGRQADALRAFQDARRVLGEELGLDPGPGLRRLEQQILDHDPSLDRAAGRAAVAAAPSEPAPAPAVLTGPLLVGRAEEVDRLRAAIDAAAAGRTTFAVISGEAGIGKTTLVRAAGAGSPRVLWGRSQEQASDGALWPWRQVVQAIAGEGAGAAGVLLDSAPGQGIGASADRLQVYDAVGRLLTSAAADEPLVVVLEDIHWADADSLRLLDYLATELHDAAVAVVVTVRPDEAQPGTAVAGTLAALARRADLVRVELTGLGPEHMRTFALEVGGLDLDAAAADSLHGRTSGNPFFLTELVRLLSAERGRRHEPISTTAVPASVRDVVRRRVERLPDDSRTVLSVAAVAGAAVGIDVLAQACAIDADAVLDALEPPFLTGLVEEAGAGGEQVRFAHALVAETLSVDLPTVRRRRLHGRIADAIEVVHAHALDDHLASLAHHHGQAAAIGHAGAATRFALLAAEQAERRGAVIEAARLRNDACTTAELDASSTPEQRLDLALGAATALGRSGDARVRERVVDAIDRAEALGDVVSMARAALSLVGHGTTWTWADMRTRHQDVITRLERTLAALGEGDGHDRARVLGILALGVYTDQRELALRLGDESVEMARRIGDDHLVGECLATQLVILNDMDQARRRAALADELIELGDRIGRPELVLSGLACRIDYDLIEGALERADATYARGLVVLEQYPNPQAQMQLAMYPPRRHLVAGRFDEAEAANERSYELRRLLTVWWGAEEAYFSLLFDIRREQGRLGELVPWLDFLGDERVLIGNIRVQALVEDGQLDAARERLATSGLRRPVEDWWWIAEAVTATEVVCELGDRSMGAELFEQLLPFAGWLSCNGSITVAPPIDLYLGRLALLLDDREAAIAYLRAALDLAQRIGAPPFEAQAAVHLGRVLGDADLLARAAALAEELGMARVAKLAR
ncbi:MAG: AAA family ATPase [Acidimicrobiia bacterium]|nr:AAA family ATPase [Acidimicrobiia bacterium]